MKKMFIMAGLVFIFGYAANYVYCAPEDLMDTNETREAIKEAEQKKQEAEQARQEAIEQAEKDIEQAPIKAVLKQIYDKLRKGEPPETIIADIKDTLQANPDIKDKLFKGRWDYSKLVDIIVDAGNDYASVIGYIAGIIDLNDSNYWGWGHPLCQAALEGYDKVVELLLNHPKTNPNNKTKYNNRTALHYAADNGHYKVVEKLLKHIDPNVKDSGDWTALHYAANNGHYKVVELLLNHPKTDPNNKTKFDNRTALHYAANNGHYKVVEKLLKHIDPNVKDSGDWTALHYAANNGHYKVVELLLNHPKINPNNKTKYNNRTALHLAALKGDTSIIDILLNHPKTKLNAKNKWHQTALHWAIYVRQIKAVKLLLIYGVETDGLDEYQKKFVNKVLRDMNIDRERKDKFNELISEQRYVGALRIFSLIERKTQNEIFKKLAGKNREMLEKQVGEWFNSEILPFFTPSAAASEVQEEVIE